MPDEVKREASGVQSGLYQYESAGPTWSPIEFDGPYLEFQALAAHSRGETHYLFAGTATDGVFRSTDNGASWTACNTNLTNLMINALFSFENTLYAGTTDGTVFRSLDDGQNWEQFSTGSVVERVIENEVVTEIRLVADGLPKMAVHGLAAYKNGQFTLYAGSDNGVYQSSDNGVTWCPAADTPLSAVRALLVKGEQIFAGTSLGLFTANVTETPLAWTRVSDVGEVAIHALATDGTSIWAATDDGIYQCDGDNWELMDAQIDGQTASALTVSNNNLLAVTPSANSIAEEWPGFEIDPAQKEIDLDTVYDNVLADS